MRATFALLSGAILAYGSFAQPLPVRVQSLESLRKQYHLDQYDAHRIEQPTRLAIIAPGFASLTEAAAQKFQFLPAPYSWLGPADDSSDLGTLLAAIVSALTGYSPDRLSILLVPVRAEDHLLWALPRMAQERIDAVLSAVTFPHRAQTSPKLRAAIDHFLNATEAIWFQAGSEAQGAKTSPTDLDNVITVSALSIQPPLQLEYDTSADLIVERAAVSFDDGQRIAGPAVAAAIAAGSFAQIHSFDGEFRDRKMVLAFRSYWPSSFLQKKSADQNYRHLTKHNIAPSERRFWLPPTPEEEVNYIASLRQGRGELPAACFRYRLQAARKPVTAPPQKVAAAPAPPSPPARVPVDSVVPLQLKNHTDKTWEVKLDYFAADGSTQHVVKVVPAGALVPVAQIATAMNFRATVGGASQSYYVDPTKYTYTLDLLP